MCVLKTLSSKFDGSPNFYNRSSIRPWLVFVITPKLATLLRRLIRSFYFHTCSVCLSRFTFHSSRVAVSISCSKFELLTASSGEVLRHLSEIIYLNDLLRSLAFIICLHHRLALSFVLSNSFFTDLSLPVVLWCYFRIPQELSPSQKHIFCVNFMNLIGAHFLFKPRCGFSFAYGNREALISRVIRWLISYPEPTLTRLRPKFFDSFLINSTAIIGYLNSRNYDTRYAYLASFRLLLSLSLSKKVC